MKEFTTADFKANIKKGNVVVDFWAPWCGPCKMMAPTFEEASKNHTSVTFAKVNVDDNPEVAQELGVRGIPTVIFFKNGEEVTRSVGAVSKAALESKLKENFA